MFFQPYRLFVCLNEDKLSNFKKKSLKILILRNFILKFPIIFSFTLV